MGGSRVGGGRLRVLTECGLPVMRLDPIQEFLAPPCVTHCFQDDHRRESSRLDCITDRK